MSFVTQESVFGYSKPKYTDDTFDEEKYESEEEEDYDESLWEDVDFAQDEYESFIEEKEIKRRPKVIKPAAKINSPLKSPKVVPPPPPSWWDKVVDVDDNVRLINGVLNYSAILPIPAPKPKQLKKKRVPKPPQPPQPTRYQPTRLIPSRLCLSVVKKTRCFHKDKCRFAHDINDLKECHYGSKCNKVKTTSNAGEYLNVNTASICPFKHSNETQVSYVKRVPQQTSPRKP